MNRQQAAYRKYLDDGQTLVDMENEAGISGPTPDQAQRFLALSPALIENALLYAEQNGEEDAENLINEIGAGWYDEYIDEIGKAIVARLAEIRKEQTKVTKVTPITRKRSA